MRRSIASRKAIASIFTAAWSIFGAQSGYSQPPIEEGKIYWAHPESGIHRSSLDGSNAEQLVIPDLRRPDKIALDIAGGKMYWTEREWASLHRSDLDGSNTETLREGDGYLGWSGVLDLALDIEADKIYWTEWYSHGDYISSAYFRANLDGSDIEQFDDIVIYRMALDVVEKKMYWAGEAGIYRTDLDGSNVENVYQYYVVDIILDVAGGKIYWAESRDAIKRADLDGSNVENVITDTGLIGYYTEIALDIARGKIYWTNPHPHTEAGAIHRANLDGSDVETLLKWEGVISFAFDLDQSKLYWTGDRDTIQRSNLDGTNVEVLFSPEVKGPYGIALDPGGGKMYWSDLMVGSIQRANLDGSSMEVLITGLEEPRGIALIAGSKIYWADSGTGKIQTADLDGSQVEDIITGLNHPEAITLDRGRSRMYWMNRDSVFRANLDGSHVEKIATVRSSGYVSSGIALDQHRDKMYWTNRDSVFRANLDGSHIEKIVTFDYRWDGWNEAIVLDPVGGKIYWTAFRITHSTDWLSPAPRYWEIFRANLDGSNVEEIRSVHIDIGRGAAPTGIALDLPHPTSVSTPGTTPAIPTTSGLDPNFPNPFNASTQIAYRLASPGLVRLEIYNVLGQPVRTLVNQSQPAGFYQVRWDARDQRGSEVAAGVYLTRLRHPDGAQTRRLLYLK